MSYKTRDGKTHQSTVIMGDNGLPIDGIATIAGSYVFLESGVDPLVYTAVAATVTLPVGNDLSPVVSAKARYTGRYVLITKDNSIYYINRQSIDVANRTFVISRSDSAQITPVALDLSPGWQVAEADIVNRMATTSSAKVDSVEFRDLHFQMQLDGDPVTLLNQDGVGINPATEEKQDDQIAELGLINDELDTITIQLAQIDDQINQDYGASTDAIRTASQIGNPTGAADFNLGLTTAQTLRTTANMAAVSPDGASVNLESSGVDSSNSSNTPLDAGGVFTGAWKDISLHSNLSFMVNSDANGTLSIQYSTDGVNIHRTLSGVYNADPNGLYITLPPETQYYRLIYTNGGVAQTRFSLQSVLTTTPVGVSTVPVNFPIVDSNSVSINRSVITGKSTDGQYVNQRASGVSSANSTTTLLSAGQTFTGAFEEVVGYTTITVISFANVGSAVDGLKLEFSSDGINVDDNDTFTLSAEVGNQYSVGITSKYFRVRYVNGASPQTTFRLQTIYHITAPKPSTHRIDDIINGQNDAELSKSVITGKQENGSFNNVGLSNSSSLKVAITDRPSEVRGRVRKEAAIFAVALTATPTVIYTVTPGKTLYVQSFIISAINVANTIGAFRIRDGATDKFSTLLQDKVTGGASASTYVSPNLPEPMPFTTNVSVVETIGDVTASIYLLGYEE